MFERFYNTPARQGFHWPGRLVAGEGVLEDWLKTGPARLAIVADRAFAAHPAVAQAQHTTIVTREPHRADLAAVLPALKRLHPDAVLALGGGATLDTAKALVAELRYGSTDIRDRPRDAAPPLFIAAPTTAGSGSETSRFFILADDSGVKQATRSWAMAPDLTLLDPVLLEGLDNAGLVLGAFDAAIHLWETHIARGEASAFTDAIAQAHLPRILAALPGLAAGNRPNTAMRQSLMEASAMAGIAISNVRTGLIHTLGESLAAQCPLPHPLTLRVFLRSAIESYAHTARMPLPPQDFIAAWEDAFAALGLDDRLSAALAHTPISLDRLCATAARDTTLAKENPVPLDANMLRLIAATGLAAWPKSASLIPPLHGEGGAAQRRQVGHVQSPRTGG